jgi:hypothetical protein
VERGDHHGRAREGDAERDVDHARDGERPGQDREPDRDERDRPAPQPIDDD